MATGQRESGRRRGTRKPGTAAKTAGADLRALARDAALAALKRLAMLSRSEDERIALAATQELLNRAFGKASAAGSDEGTAARPVIVKIVRFSEIGAATAEGEGES